MDLVCLDMEGVLTPELLKAKVPVITENANVTID